MKEFFTSLELAELALPDMPGTQRGINLKAKRDGWDKRRAQDGSALARTVNFRGGGTEYHYSLFPTAAQNFLVARALKERKAAATKPQPKGVGERWAVFDRLTDKKKQKARSRLDVLDAVLALTRGGQPKNVAVSTIAGRERISARSIYDWFKLVEGIDKADWLPFLSPQHKGPGRCAEMPDAAWELFKADYLRPEQPTALSCYRRLERQAAEHGWSLPHVRAFTRRVEREVAPEIQVLLRKGAEELERMYPYQERDRSAFHAMEAITADGHKCDVMVEWPDGEITRPQVVAVQDLYSGKIVAWRVDKTLTSTGVRLAFYDMFRDYGIPDHAYLDNGREFASKMITGGAPTRFRFKVKDDEPTGVLTGLGVQVHWTTPYHGQAKPIERAFGDWARDMAKDPRLAGAYTGNAPQNKPSNYGSKAAPLDTFLTVLDEYIAESNQRAGRRSRVCGGQLSFDQAFLESYAKSPIKRATEEQLRMAMLAAEQVTAQRPDGSVQLLGNRFWSEVLTPHIGQKLTVRFDPEDVAAGAHIYRQDGVYIGFAECLEAGAFNSVDAARMHGRKRREYVKSVKRAAALEVGMDITDIAAGMTPPPPTEMPEPPRVQRLVASGGGRPMPVPVEEDDQEFSRALQVGALRLVEASKDGL